MLQGEAISLRTVRQDDLPLLATRAAHPQQQSGFNFFGLEWSERQEQHWQEDGLIGPHQGTLLVITAEGEIAGNVSYHEERYGPNSGSTAYNIGIELIPEQRGKGYGSEAQRLLAAYLFSVYPIMRIDALTDITNLAEQGALEKAGFTREGMLRKAQWRAGGWHDLIMYSKLRGE